jgi:hypothetical protein
MVRLAACFGALLAVPALAPAQAIVVAGYAPPIVAPAPVVTAYYAPAPVASYYAPAPVTTYYAPAPAPVVTSYYAPAVSYYTPPSVSYYSTPSVTTYRYPILRPRTTVVRTYPGTVASYYTPAVIVP